MSRKYRFTADAGHGWLAVKVSELVALGIADKISTYSYIKGMTAYLEEDCDLSRFFEAKTKAMPLFSFDTDVISKHVDRATIRSYDRYDKTKFA